MKTPLKALLRALHLSQLTLIDTASKTQSKLIANICYATATRRGKFASEVSGAANENATRNNDGTPLDSVSMARLRSILRNGNDYQLLGELTRRDMRLIEQYRATLDVVRDERVAAKLREHLKSLVTDYDRLTAVRDLHAPSPY